MRKLRIVARIGDGDNYHFYEDFYELADALKEAGAKAIEYHNHWGVKAEPHLIGNNYISLYWAMNKTMPMKPVTPQDIQDINLALKKVQNEPATTCC